uniref:Uncharacterized protein n=1 Tax=Aegilops tauschii subsp. strangulata TaxID=200361 RepID=A0A452YUK2_AEGTS
MGMPIILKKDNVFLPTPMVKMQGLNHETPITCLIVICPCYKELFAAA